MDIVGNSSTEDDIVDVLLHSPVEAPELMLRGLMDSYCTGAAGVRLERRILPNAELIARLGSSARVSCEKDEYLGI